MSCNIYHNWCIDPMKREREGEWSACGGSLTSSMIATAGSRGSNSLKSPILSRAIPRTSTRRGIVAWGSRAGRTCSGWKSSPSISTWLKNCCTIASRCFRYSPKWGNFYNDILQQNDRTIEMNLQNRRDLWQEWIYPFDVLVWVAIDHPILLNLMISNRVMLVNQWHNLRLM